MSTHTPGSWVARPDPNGTADDFCIGLNDDCSPIDYVAVCHKRDARLIAAAPELLDALEDIIADIGPHMVISPITGKQLVILRKGREAIAKATGAA